MNQPFESIEELTDGRAFAIEFDPDMLWTYMLTNIRGIGAINRIPVLCGFPDWAIARAISDIAPDEARILAMYSADRFLPFDLSIHSTRFGSVRIAGSEAELQAALEDFDNTAAHGLLLIEDAESGTAGAASLQETHAGGVAAIIAAPGNAAAAQQLRDAATEQGLHPAIVQLRKLAPVPVAEFDGLLSAYDALFVIDSEGGPVRQAVSDWHVRSTTRMAVSAADPSTRLEDMIDGLFGAAVMGGRYEDPR